MVQPETKALTKEDKLGHQKSRSMMALGLDCFQNKGVRRGRGFDMVREEEVKSSDDHWIRDDGDVSVVISGVDEVFSGKGISGCHPCTRYDLPMDIEIL